MALWSKSSTLDWEIRGWNLGGTQNKSSKYVGNLTRRHHPPEEYQEHISTTNPSYFGLESRAVNQVRQNKVLQRNKNYCPS